MAPIAIAMNAIVVNIFFSKGYDLHSSRDKGITFMIMVLTSQHHVNIL